MRREIKVTFICLVLLVFINAYSVENSKVDYELETLSISSGTTPFWLRANRFGEIGDRDQIVGKISIQHYVTVCGIKIETGGELYYNFLEKNIDNANIGELYIDGKYLGHYASIGIRKRDEGMSTEELSTGPLIVSRNAPAIPQIRIGSTEYVDVPLTKSRLGFKWLVANGWLGEQRRVRDALLIEKELDFKLRVNNRLALYTGVRHDAVWGGTNPDGSKNPQDSFQDYLDVFFVRRATADNAAQMDKENAAGDHKGQYQWRAEYKYDKAEIAIFADHFFEDHSGKHLEELYDYMIRKGDFPKEIDGRFGININFIKKSIIDSVLVEHINTKYQSGPEPHNVDIGGRDSYYENGLFGAWKYKGKEIGNPLIIIKENEKYNIIGEQSHTRIRAQNMGIKGRIFDDIDYRVNISLAHYFLSYRYVEYPDGNPLKKIFNEGLWQNYYLLELKKENIVGTPIFGILRLGYDNGEIYKGNFGQEVIVGTSIYF